MSDAIVKHQDRIPMDVGDLLRVLRDALEVARAGGGAVLPPYRLAGVVLDGPSGDDPRLSVLFEGPAGLEEFTVSADGVVAEGPPED